MVSKPGVFQDGLIQADSPDSQALLAAKAALRRDLRARRRAAAQALGDRAGEDLAAAALAGIGTPAGMVVGGYWPLPGEIDPRPLMAALARSGAALALPVVVALGAPLTFRAWAPGAPLEDGLLSTRQPLATAPEVRPDWLLVPLLGFDGAGYRLGLGGGFYDRTLAALAASGPAPRTLGLAFSDQEVDVLPRGRHDYPLDAVVTERGVRCSPCLFPAAPPRVSEDPVS
jgi:5-formyltetrahydrofolate cyclo-ligase